MTDKRVCTPREAAAFALFAMAEDGAPVDPLDYLPALS